MALADWTATVTSTAQDGTRIRAAVHLVNTETHAEVDQTFACVALDDLAAQIRAFLAVAAGDAVDLTPPPAPTPPDPVAVVLDPLVVAAQAQSAALRQLQDAKALLPFVVDPTALAAATADVESLQAAFDASVQTVATARHATLAAGAKSCAVHLKGASSMAPLPIEVQLTAISVDDGVRAGLTALPNAAAEAAGGLYTRGSGAGQITQDANGRIDTNTKAWAGTAVTLTSSLPDVNTKTIAAGIIAAATFAANALDAVWSTAVRLLTAGTNIVLAKGTGLTGLNDIAATAIVSSGAITTSGGKVSEVALVDALTAYTGNTPQTGDAFARLGAPAGASVSADLAAVNAKTTNLPAAPASTTNITGGTITTVTSLTNAPTAGDLTAAMKASVATAVLDAAVDGAVTARQSLRLANSAGGGKLSGAATAAIAIRDLADTKDRVSATVDADGNRTAVTLDLT